MVFTIVINLYGKNVEEQLRAKLAKASHTYSKDASVVGWHPQRPAQVDHRRALRPGKSERGETLRPHGLQGVRGRLSGAAQERSGQLDVHQFQEL
ncbi:hypothetical protein PR003_g29610 [Phytophthora rubi]|uniref:Uncharacterized protein n=1 Tax=Phytophthora rubi TaxID=129364 RepID=A0A6A3H921_9STRA|nr:hypothetical protein PR002_g28508 [Phytophthora rubi]KAE8987088.1 hypothetical protein PR001_g22427 [Phytophthora rubi]KAE9274425.1 hypothetical protein PR003_g29610 [Phytophthora rubi]